MAEEFDSQSFVTNPSSSTFLPLTETKIVADLVAVCLTRTNYPLWRSSIVPILKYYGMFNMVEGTEQPPPQFMTDRRGKISPIENPAYSSWIMKDQTCTVLINATLSYPIIPYTLECTSARDIWLNLEKRFATIAKFHVLQLKACMQTLKKERMMSMEKYLKMAEEIVEALADAGSPLDVSDYVGYVLKGLPADYNDIVTIIRARGDAVTLEEVHALLVHQASTCWDWGNLSQVTLLDKLVFSITHFFIFLAFLLMFKIIRHMQ